MSESVPNTDLDDPDFLVSRLVEIAPDLSEEQRQFLSRRLVEAGLGALAPWPEESAQKLADRLQLPPEHPLDASRFPDLLFMLADVVVGLEQIAWSTWQIVAPQSTLRRGTPLLRILASYATGAPDSSEAALRDHLDRLSQLIAAVIAAIGNAAKQFAHSHAVKFAPSEIEAIAGMERSGVFVSREAKCWRKYKELATNQDETAIEADIRQAIADFAETLIHGPGR